MPLLFRPAAVVYTAVTVQTAKPSPPTAADELAATTWTTSVVWTATAI